MAPRGPLSPLQQAGRLLLLLSFGFLCIAGFEAVTGRPVPGLQHPDRSFRPLRPHEAVDDLIIAGVTGGLGLILLGANTLKHTPKEDDDDE